jgi:hypothetical protein
MTPAPAPRAAPKPEKTVGTPVVHGDEAKIAEATEKAKAKADARKAADETAAAGKTAKAKAPAKFAAAADEQADDAKLAKVSTKKGGKPTADEDGKTARGRKAKASDDEDSGTRSGRSSRSAKAEKAEKAKAEKAAPPRIYVQVAGGANRDDMDKAWAGVKKKAPELMKGHTASTVPVHATNRLVVGPFKDQAEAQAFVNKAAGKGVSAFVVTSEKGQKYEKLGGGE